MVARRCGSHGREEGLIRGEACRGTELHVGEGPRERGARIKGMHGGRGARVKGMGVWERGVRAGEMHGKGVHAGNEGGKNSVDEEHGKG